MASTRALRKSSSTNVTSSSPCIVLKLEGKEIKGMTVGNNLASVRSFIRHLNVVVKQVNLYGLAHKQVVPQLESTWRELQASLRDGKLPITAAGDHLLVNGKPLQAGTADKSMAQMLVSAGIAGICFFPEMDFESLGILVQILATTKPQDLLPEFKRQFGPKAPVRLLEFHIGGEEPVNAGMNLTGALASAMLNNLQSGAAVSNGQPASTNDLMRLLCSVEAQNGESAQPNTSDGASVPCELGENDVAETIRWLARLSAGKNGKNKDGALPHAQELPVAGLSALKEALEASGGQTLEKDRPALLSLAEQLAVKVALDKYQRGEVPFNAVQEMLQRLKKEIETLHKVLKAHEDTMYRAGLAVESESEALDRQFWAAVPAKNKTQVLLSAEAWCIPPKNIRSFVTELLEKSDVGLAEQILRNYCSLLRTAEDRESKLKVADGVAVLSTSFARVGVRATRWAMSLVSGELGCEVSTELTPSLCTALAALVHEAANAQNYEIVPMFFDQLAELQSVAPQISERVHIEAGIEGCAERFLDDAMSSQTVAPELIEALQQMPYAVAHELKKRAGSCAKRDVYRKLTGLTETLGTPLLEALRQSATADRASDALPAIGLLTPLDSVFVEHTLRNRLPSWSPMYQAAAIHQIACSGMTERGILLTQLFDSFHELIVPQVIDEIGISGTAKMDRLLKEAAKAETVTPYVQLKVIEALGNLKAKDAVELLRVIVLARSVWKWEFPKETRIVALQAILKIDPLVAQTVMTKAGITAEELQLAPLRPGSNDWIRQRRYLRVPLDGDMWASITSKTGSCDVSLEALSLGGGGGRTNSRTQLGPDGEVELKIGLRKLRARVLLHAMDSYKIGFEIASIPLEDRTRLRQFLTAKRHK